MGKQNVENVTLITFREESNTSDTNKRVLLWYHLYQAQPGQTRMEQTFKQLFTQEGMSRDSRMA